MQIFHIAEAKRWEAAKLAGSYAQSTLGQTLDEVGFIHAARADQVDGVRERFYADVTEPLVLLVIDTDRLTSPWREDPVGDTTFPHIHGPLNISAVLSALPLGGTTPATSPTSPTAAAVAPASTGQPGRSDSQRQMLRSFLGEMAFRMGMAIIVMAFVVIGAALSDNLDRGPWLGIAVGLALGVTIACGLAILRRRSSRS